MQENLRRLFVGKNCASTKGKGTLDGWCLLLVTVGHDVEGRFELKGCFSCQCFWCVPLASFVNESGPERARHCIKK